MNMLHEEKLCAEKPNTHGSCFERDVDFLQRAHIGCNFNDGAVSASRDYRAVGIKRLSFLQCSGNTRFDIVAGGSVRVRMDDAATTIYSNDFSISELLNSGSKA